MKNHKKIDSIYVNLADDGAVQAIGVGDIVMAMTTPSGIRKGFLKEIWHIPKLSRNLFSIGRFTKDVAPLSTTNAARYS